MRALEFITGHVIYNPAYTYKFQLKTTLWLEGQFLDDHAVVTGKIWFAIGHQLIFRETWENCRW